MKTKKLNRYQRKIKLLEEELKEANNNCEYYKREYNAVEERKDKEIENMKSVFGRVEGSESLLASENRWLRDTLFLITVPADKLKELDRLRIERMNDEEGRVRMRRPY